MLTMSDLSNLITACKTSSMRTSSPLWQAKLDKIAVKLDAMRTALVERKGA